MRILSKSLTALFLSGLLFSCVSSKKFEEISKQNTDCDKERGILKAENQRLDSELKDCASTREQLTRANAILNNDTILKGKQYRNLQREYSELDKHNTELEALAEDKISGSRGETREVLKELNLRENKLRKLEDSLVKQRKNLAELGLELEAREARVKELENIIKEQKESVTKLKERIAAALKGFTDSGLKVYEKNGKVYVSMDEKLLFESGKTEVSEEGKKALTQLAAALAKEKQLNVMIEGHTDNVPLAGTGFMKDNWDLSVLRATSIVRILLQNKSISPDRFISAGRAEFLPVGSNETKEGRAQNRRTEIIITPQLNQLFEILKND